MHAQTLRRKRTILAQDNNHIITRPTNFFSAHANGGQNNSEDQVRATKNLCIFAKSKKRLPNPTPYLVIWNKNSRDMCKKSEKVTYKMHF